MIGLRCGGHNGAPMSRDTILIDMSAFKAVTIDSATKQVTFGGGCTWGDVYEPANKAGLTVVGGGYHGVGVGGYLTGGGYSWWSGKYGMGGDNGTSLHHSSLDSTDPVI
jgi:FAD/FMN-containing dehydrogenase